MLENNINHKAKVAAKRFVEDNRETFEQLAKLQEISESLILDE